MNFLKNLFGGGNSGGRSSSDGGLYFYVRPRGCEEVIEVRINPANDLSKREEGGYFIRKTVRGQHRCFNPAEMTLYFGNNKNFETSEVSGGEMLDKAAYEQYQAARAAKQQAIREQNAAVDAANAEEKSASADDDMADLSDNNRS